MTEEKSRFGMKTEARIFSARLSILFEGLLSYFFKPALVIAVFVILSLLDFWVYVGPVIHVVLMVGAAAVLIWFLITDRHLAGFASRTDALRRVEESNRLAHQPLQSKGHHLAQIHGLGAGTEALWAAYQNGLIRYAGKLKSGRLSPVLATGDRYGFGSAALLLLVIGFTVSGPLAGARLMEALTPNFVSQMTPLEIDVWFDPPAYTNIAPLALSRDGVPVSPENSAVFDIPVGSRFVARIFGGGEAAPQLLLDGKAHEFQKIDNRNFQLELDIQTGRNLSVMKGGDSVASWDIRIIADEIPLVSMTAEPEITHRSAFRLSYKAEDDYGVQKIGAQIRLSEDPARMLDMELPMPGSARLDVEGKSYQDLTAHPWAGLNVQLTLYAEDHIRQRGYSKLILMTLPERSFLHPLARALIEQRRKLVVDADVHKPAVVIALGALMSLPEGLNNDATVITGLAFSHSSLIHGRTEKSISTVIDMLWDLALRLENGDLSLAEIALREAERKLMDALNNNAGDAEISRLVEELRQAMNKYLEAMVNAGELPPDSEVRRQGDENVIRQSELQKMLERIDQFSKLGSRDAARELLSQLQDILENLQRQAGRMPSAGEQASEQSLRELGELMRRQQELLDQTFQRSRRGPQSRDNLGQKQSGDGSPSDLSGLAAQQEALRQMLGEMMGRLGLQGKIPGAMGRAERDMNDARQSLQQGKGGQASESQGSAMDQLRRSAEQLADQLAEQMMGGSDGSPGQGRGRGQGRAGQEGRDPLGRPEGNGRAGDNRGRDMLSDLEIQFHQSKKLRDEMHRRLSDPNRPRLERDYLKRLLKRF